MMNKALRMSLFAAGVALSTNAFSVDTLTTIGTGTGATTATISNVNDCSALSRDATVQLSSGVVASYICSATSVMAGTCHTKGSNKSQDFKCTYTSATVNGVTTYYTATGCPAWDGSGTQPDAKYTNSGVVGFRGGSGGGSVSVVGMGVTVCDTTTVQKLVQ